MKITLSLAILAGSIALALPQAAHAKPPRPIGSSEVLAPVPASPGYPEGIAVHDGLVYVSGPAAFGIAVASQIFAYDQETGALVRTLTIKGQTGPSRAISCIAFGEDENLYVLDEQQGVLKINVETGHQSVYASGFHPVFNSSFNAPGSVLINDLAFDKKGNLYVTDSFQATIWRVPPSGGTAQVWFQAAQLDGPFGPNGVRVDAKSKNLYFVQSLNGGGQGFIYSLPLVETPALSDLKLVHAFNPGQVPDGIAFGKSGNLYVALAGSSQIAVLDPNGFEVNRYSGPAQIPGHPGTTLPWANPANIAFNNKTGALLVTNHASLTGLPDPSPLFAVFDVVVKDKAGKLFSEGED